MTVPPPVHRAGFSGWRNGQPAAGTRAVPEEAAVAFSYNRVAHAVMMATPADLEDFAVGFSLNEGIVGAPGEIAELTVVPAGQGIELRMWIEGGRMDALVERRRHLAGATGCGMCGLESLEAAMRKLPRVTSSLCVTSRAVAAGVAALAPAQHLNRQTRAVHGAAFWTAASGLVALREDVGRHNALDKLAGHLARQGVCAAEGVLVLTSRISVELVQKAAAMGAPVLAAVSAPTALALRVAEQAGITLIGVARDDGFEIYTHPDRIAPEPVSHVA